MYSELNEADMIAAIRCGEPVHAKLQGGGLILRIDEYVPFVCTAIHHGHDLRKRMASHCALSADERLYEEDPHTGDLIRSMPITIVATDSRYEYDLNRPASRCVYGTAWGREVWKDALLPAMIRKSREKHARFYRILDAVIAAVERRFAACLVFDLHSYNHQRIEGGAPTFNLGTSQIDIERWREIVGHFRDRLGEISIASLENTVGVDEVFQGRGYLISHVNDRFNDTLVIPTEIAKIYMDETGGEAYPMVLESLGAELARAISATAAHFSNRHTRTRGRRRSDMLPAKTDANLELVDSALYDLSRNFDVLEYLAPTNLPRERKSFFRSGCRSEPKFEYRPVELDPYHFRQCLYRLPVSNIRDPSIRLLYRELVDRMAQRIDLMTSIGDRSFRYNSMRYFGEPSARDRANARFLLHVPQFECARAVDGAAVSAQEAADFFRARCEQWRLPCKVDISTRIVAKAMIRSARRRLVVNGNLTYTKIELEALAHHELGVHLVTTLNARRQHLRAFELGLPGATEAQEGLAIASEHYSGHLTWPRLRELALRTLAVSAMLQDATFSETYWFLHDDFALEPAAAFGIALRVHRGGGFTKDFLYLRGLARAVAARHRPTSTNLFVGKVGFDQWPLIDELRERNVISAPHHVPPAWLDPAPDQPVIEYILRGISEAPRSHRLSAEPQDTRPRELLAV